MKNKDKIFSLLLCTAVMVALVISAYHAGTPEIPAWDVAFSQSSSTTPPGGGGSSRGSSCPHNMVKTATGCECKEDYVDDGKGGCTKESGDQLWYQESKTFKNAFCHLAYKLFYDEDDLSRFIDKNSIQQGSSPEEQEAFFEQQLKNAKMNQFKYSENPSPKPQDRMHLNYSFFAQ